MIRNTHFPEEVVKEEVTEISEGVNYDLQDINFHVIRKEIIEGLLSCSKRLSESTCDWGRT